MEGKIRNILKLSRCKREKYLPFKRTGFIRKIPSKERTIKLWKHSPITKR